MIEVYGVYKEGTSELCAIFRTFADAELFTHYYAELGMEPLEIRKIKTTDKTLWLVL